MQVLVNIGENRYISNITIPTQEAIESLVNEIGKIDGDISLCDPPAWVVGVVARTKYRDFGSKCNHVHIVIGNVIDLDLDACLLNTCEVTY